MLSYTGIEYSLNGVRADDQVMGNKLGDKLIKVQLRRFN
jgi:hypothetical protein